MEDGIACLEMRIDMDYTLLAIVDSGFVTIEEIERRIEEVARGGATWLQIRGKGLATGTLIRYVREAGRAARAVGLPFVVNDRVDVASLTGADGVHVGEHDLPVRDVRRILGPDAIVGATVRDAEAACRAEKDGASCLGVGPLFPSAVKPDLRPLTRETVRAIREATTLPLIGIAGVDRSNAGRAREWGLDGVAVISALWRSADPEESARLLVRGFCGGEEK